MGSCANTKEIDNHVHINKRIDSSDENNNNRGNNKSNKNNNSDKLQNRPNDAKFLGK
jgi:hypothetical protein